MFDVHARSFAIVGTRSSISSYFTAICKQHSATRCKDVFGTTVFDNTRSCASVGSRSSSSVVRSIVRHRPHRARSCISNRFRRFLFFAIRPNISVGRGEDKNSKMAPQPGPTGWVPRDSCVAHRIASSTHHVSYRDVRRRRPVPLPRAHVQNPLHQLRPVRRVMRRRAVQHERPVIRAKKDNA